MGKDALITVRTKQFSLRVIKACHFLERSDGVLAPLSELLLTAGTSIGLSIRKAHYARSQTEFLHRLEVALKAARETQYWLELIIESDLVDASRFYPLLDEAAMLHKIFVASIHKLQNRGNSASEKS